MTSKLLQGSTKNEPLVANKSKIWHYMLDTLQLISSQVKTTGPALNNQAEVTDKVCTANADEDMTTVPVWHHGLCGSTTQC